MKTASIKSSSERVAERYLAKKKPQPVQESKDDSKVVGPGPKRRNQVVQDLIQRGQSGAGKHHTRERDLATGRSRKPKHKKELED